MAVEAITKKHTVPLMLVAVAEVVVLAVKATVVVTVAVVREGMTVVGSKVLKTSGASAQSQAISQQCCGTLGHVEGKADVDFKGYDDDDDDDDEKRDLFLDNLPDSA
ncbi:hypothetical protein BTVI_101778 [Pitangus sulphuratus]|nr:hypothetical protein BTVI_101778 [Pitangus sulphuratus]